jgi:hypothetical protein
VGRPGKLRVDEVHADLEPADRVLLCSDGVYGELKKEAEIARLVRLGTAEEAAVHLINAALAKGGRDNATAVALEVGTERARREASDGGLARRDQSFAAHSPLLAGLDQELTREALQSAVEVSFDVGERLPRFSASDRVAYILVEGSVRTPEGWTLGPGALLYPESLGGGGKGPSSCEAQQSVRALRIRSDDVNEVCASKPGVGAALYGSLARYLARKLA